MIISLWHRVAQEPLIQAIMNTNMTITRAHATKILQRWFCISLRNGIAVEGMTRRHFEGVTLDTQAEEMSPSEAETWADDDAVMRWIVQFTGSGPEGNLFQGNVNVSTLTLLYCDTQIVRSVTPDGFQGLDAFCYTAKQQQQQHLLL